MCFDRGRRGFKTIDLEHIICVSIGNAAVSYNVIKHAVFQWFRGLVALIKTQTTLYFNGFETASPLLKRNKPRCVSMVLRPRRPY